MRIADNVAWTHNGGRVVVLDLAEPASAPIALEASAASIWHEIAGADDIGIDALLTGLASAFETTESEIQHDVETVVARLAESRLLVL